MLQMDPAEEMRDRKRQMEHSEMLRFVADLEYGIPRSCACGGRMIDEVRCKEEYDYLPGKRFFTCTNYQASSSLGFLFIKLEQRDSDGCWCCKQG